MGAVELAGRETDSDGQRMEVGELAPDMVFQTLWHDREWDAPGPALNHTITNMVSTPNTRLLKPTLVIHPHRRWVHVMPEGLSEHRLDLISLNLDN